MVLARILGREGYGIYAYALVVVMVASVVVQLGLPRLVLRETAKALVTEDWPAIARVWRWAGRVCLLTCAGVTMILVATVHAVIDDPFLRWTMTLAAGLTPILALSALRAGTLRGLGHVLLGQLPDHVVRPLVLLALILWAWLTLGQLRPDHAMVLNLLATMIGFGVGAWALIAKTPQGVRDTPPVRAGKPGWITATLTMAFTASMVQINGYADILILGALRDAEDVGAYRIAQQASMLAASGLHIASMVYAPRLAQANKRGDTLALQRLMKNGARLALGAATAVTLVLILGAPTAIGFLLEPAFVDSYAPLIVLSIGQVLSSFFGTVGVLLNMSGLERQTALAMAVGAIGNIALNFVLIPRFGMVGAAVATSLTLLVWNLMMWRAARRRLGVGSTALGI